MPGRYRGPPASRAGIEADRQVRRRAEQQPVDVRVFGAGIQAQPRQAVEHRVQQHPRLQPGQVHAQALVRPVAERQVLLALPEDVEDVREDVPPGVAVGRAERDRHEAAGRNAHAAQLHLLGRRPGHGQRRGLPPQRLLDRLRHQVPVGADRVQLVWPREQAEQQVAGRPVGGLRPGRQEQQQEGIDLVVAEPAPVDLGLDQLAHQIIAGMPPPVGDDLGEVAAKLLAGGDRAVPVAHHRDQFGRQPVEARPVGLGQAEDPGDDPDREREGQLRDEVGVAVAGEGVDQLADGGADDRVAPLVQDAGAEGLRDQGAVAQMLGRVHLQDGPAHDLPDGRRVAGAGEPRAVGEHLLRELVAGDREQGRHPRSLRVQPRPAAWPRPVAEPP